MACEQPIPHTGEPIPNLGVYTNETQPMAREPTHGSRATHPQPRESDPPHRGQDGRNLTPLGPTNFQKL